MESDDEPRTYAELTPVSLTSPNGSRTEVKIPYTPHRTEGGVNTDSCTVNGIDSCIDTMNMGITYGVSDGAVAQGGADSEQNGETYLENETYKSLVTTYRGIPREMFVSKVLRDNASCESKLDEMRSSLFEYLKEVDEFPYGLQCMLKRRKGMRNGDSVAIKLTNDIHTLMSVLEGAEFSDMRDMISSGSGRSQRSQSSPSSVNESITHSDSSMELKVLSDAVNTLQAELLHLKQTHNAVETMRSKEIQTLKSTIIGLKSDLSSLTTTKCCSQYYFMCRTN